jgi:TfoX/Sxy family transcriptional regulator of competence genes
MCYLGPGGRWFRVTGLVEGLSPIDIFSKLLPSLYQTKYSTLIMAFDENLADRIRRSLKEKGSYYTEKKMFGGLCFMVDDKMCVGIIKDELMARVGEAAYPEALSKPGAKEMNFTGRAMKGYVFVEPEGIDFDEDLDYYIQACLDFNSLAKASKK